MKYIITIILAVLAINSSAQTSFDKVMEDYNAAYTSATNPDSVNKAYEKIISNAQQAFDAQIESEFNADLAALAAEEEAAKKELQSLGNQKDEAAPIEPETPSDKYDWIATDYPAFWQAYQSLGSDYIAIAKTRGVLTADMSKILERLQLPSSGSESEKIERIIINIR